MPEKWRRGTSIFTSATLRAFIPPELLHWYLGRKHVFNGLSYRIICKSAHFRFLMLVSLKHYKARRCHRKYDGVILINSLLKHFLANCIFVPFCLSLYLQEGFHAPSHYLKKDKRQRKLNIVDSV